MLGDTIFAIASPPGASERGILRVSGPCAIELVSDVLDDALPVERGVYERTIEVLGFGVACAALVMPGPRSYTGEDVVELHLPGSPLLLENVQARWRGEARDATPGEFTRRAFEAGRLDLAAAESVLQLIHASGEAAGRRALDVLRGGLRRGVDEVRSRLVDARSLLEAGLDFTDGETGEVEPEQWLPGLEACAVRLSELRGGLPPAAVGGELLLVGRANAGKSSLCNALAGEAVVLVSEEAGTTRDVLVVEVAPGVRLLDAPGDLDESTEGSDAAALAWRDRQAVRAAGAVLVIDPTEGAGRELPATELPVVAVVFTKLDLVVAPESVLALPPVPQFWVSNETGAGLAALRTFLNGRRSAGPVGSGRRIADLLERAEVAVRRACDGGRERAPEELVAEDLAAALSQLDQVDGRSTPEDVLDRIFASFCLGK